MSQPTRYTTKLLQSDKTGRLEVCPCYEGEWVAYSDYAALAAEKEAETKATFDAIRTITQLRDENERLRKAGDAVTLCLCADTDEQHKRRCAINWLAAKEGRDAK